MSKLDKIKEKIGYLKVIFGLMVAVEVSMVGWLFQHADRIDSIKIGIIATAIVLIAVSIVVINRAILQKIDELEEL